MFGYIKTYTPELRVRENEYYRAVYCGLCRSLGKCTGCCSRMTLNYDFVFAALIRMAVTGTVPVFSRRRCAAHPFRRRTMADPNPALDFCAGAGILLTFGKIVDDVSDERGMKRIKAGTARFAMRGMHRRALRALRGFDGISETVGNGLSALSDIEAQNIPSVDIPADCFGQTLGRLLSYGLDETATRIVMSVGKHIGRWLYIIDAADDFEEDRKLGRFNPFVLLYGSSELGEEHKRDIFNALTAELMEAEAALDLLDRADGQRDIFGIIDNILHLGMPDAQDRVLYRRNGRKDTSDERSL